MKNGFKVTAVMACLLLLSAGANGLLANCTTNSAVISIFQCGFVSWFAPPPAGAGLVTNSWWQVGYGNFGVTAAPGTVFSDTLQGTGIGPAGIFSGNDSGSFFVELDDAKLPRALGGHPDVNLIPNGSFCSNYQNSWGGGGVDGCADNPRTTAGTDNDNLLNTYVDPTYGTGYYTNLQQLDYPMALMARESTGRFFALAFVANKSRGVDQPDRADDLSEGFFDFAEVTNGDQNPITGQMDIIPWQPVPTPRADVVNYTSPTSPRDVSLCWPEIRLVHDGSVRPSGAALVNPGVGVGVLDQGPLCRYQLQSAAVLAVPVDPAALTWANVGAEVNCGAGVGGEVCMALTVNPDTALRVRTILGKKPRTASTLATQTRIGASGDLGIEPTDCRGTTGGATCQVSSPLLVVGGPLVSEQAVDTVAVKNKNAIVVTFRTTSELTVTGIDILGKGGVV